MKGKRILLIEDDVALAATIKNYLSLNGFTVSHADNGATGIQMAFSSLPDMIVCDINIPVVDGYQVYTILNEASLTHFTPFIFLTAKTSLKDIRTGMQLGADDYLTKPFDFDDLLSTINTRIAKRQKILQANEDHFLSLLNSSPHGVFVCQENKFLEVNRNLANLFGYSQKEIYDFSLTDFVSEQDKPKLQEAIDECINLRQKEFEIEFTGFDIKKNPINLKLSGSYSFYKGKESIIGNLTDISGIKNSSNTIMLNSSDLKELAGAIDHFSSDYHLISKSLINKLSGIFTTENNEANNRIELSAREHEVLQEICKGRSTSEIAEALFISERTVEKHRAAIVQKTGAKNMIEAVIFSIKNNLVQI
jgi:PAS domain S-box-containing protein